MSDSLEKSVSNIRQKLAMLQKQTNEKAKLVRNLENEVKTDTSNTNSEVVNKLMTHEIEPEFDVTQSDLKLLRKSETLPGHDQSKFSNSAK